MTPLQTAGRTRASSGGFTLIELLVSMTLMGFVAVAILFGFRIGTNAWAKGGANLDRLRTTQATFDLLNRQIGSMKAYYSMQKLKEAPVELLLFEGTSEGMRFVSNFSFKSRSAGGLWLVEYFAMKSKDSEQMDLMLNETRLPQDEVLALSVFRDIETGEDNRPVVRFPSFRPAPDSMRLVEGVQEIQFQYFLPLTPQGQAPVQTVTTGKDRLPQGVKIAFRWSQSDLRSEKDFSFVVPIHASVRQ
jgi:prepilin-type N-terminal cleavage/methylation domain-containing protein